MIVVVNTGLSRLDTFSELYVYSSGYLYQTAQVMFPGDRSP